MRKLPCLLFQNHQKATNAYYCMCSLSQDPQSDKAESRCCCQSRKKLSPHKITANNSSRFFRPGYQSGRLLLARKSGLQGQGFWRDLIPQAVAQVRNNSRFMKRLHTRKFFIPHTSGTRVHSVNSLLPWDKNSHTLWVTY